MTQGTNDDLKLANATPGRHTSEFVRNRKAPSPPPKLAED